MYELAMFISGYKATSPLFIQNAVFITTAIFA